MGIIPTRKELSKFFDYHPVLSIAFIIAGSFTLFETINAIRAPKGEGPFSSTTDGLGNSPHMHQFSKPVQEHWSKYPGGKTIGTEGYTHSHSLGASTSTTSSSSVSHAMMDRPLTDDIAPPRQVGYSDMFGINRHVMGQANLGSGNLPPAMRRRISQRQRGTAPIGNWGNVAIDVEDNISMSNFDSVGDLYGLGGLSPEVGTGWTE